MTSLERFISMFTIWKNNGHLDVLERHPKLANLISQGRFVNETNFARSKRSSDKSIFVASKTISVAPYISFSQIVLSLACIFIKHSLGLSEGTQLLFL